MGKAKPIESYDIFVKKYVEDRDRAIESKDVGQFMEFVEEYKDIYEPGVYERMLRFYAMGEYDRIMLIMWSASKICTKIKQETKEYYEHWHDDWRQKMVEKEKAEAAYHLIKERGA